MLLLKQSIYICNHLKVKSVDPVSLFLIPQHAFAFLKLHILRVRDIGCDRFNKEAFLDAKMVPRYRITEESFRAALAKET